MKSKQRLLNSIKGKEVDKVPWSPFLAYYWDNPHPDNPYTDMVKFINAIDGDPLLRGSHKLIKVSNPKCEYHETVIGNIRNFEYVTPVGCLRGGYKYAESSNTSFLNNHPVKTIEDFKILIYIMEHYELERDFEHFNQDTKELGDKGLYIPLIGFEGKTSFQNLVEYWIGTENLYYLIYDYEELFEEYINMAIEKSIKAALLCAESEADGFIFWEDSSTLNVSPKYFKKYVAPQITKWAGIVHSVDKFLIHHACGSINGLIELIACCNVDMIESITPPPTGDITVENAFNRLPSNIGLIGGIDPTVLLNSTMDELEKVVIDLLRVSNGKRFILANSDSCPPGVQFEKFKRVGEIIKHWNGDKI